MAYEPKARTRRSMKFCVNLCTAEDCHWWWEGKCSWPSRLVHNFDFDPYTGTLKCCSYREREEDENEDS